MLRKMREHPERPDFKKLSFEAKIEAKRGLGARLHILWGAMDKALLEGAGGLDREGRVAPCCRGEAGTENQGGSLCWQQD